MGFNWPNHAVRPEMLLAGPSTLSGMAADGTANFSPVAAEAPLDFEVWRGEHVFQSDVTISRNVFFTQGAVVRPAAGVTVVWNGRIWADPYQQIFDVSADGARIVGKFGNVVISPCWWGAKGDYSPATNEGTNNYKAFMACVDARHYSAGGICAHIEVPAGNYLINGPSRPAIPNPLYPAAPGQPYQPEHLSEAGILQLYIGDTITGMGKASTGLTFSNLCTGTGWAISIGGKDSSGPPSFVGGLFIGTPPELPNYTLAGAVGGFANGLDMADLWVTSFGVGILMDSTSQTLTRTKTEYCGDGARVHHGNTTVTTYESNLCGNAIVVEFRAAAAPAVITDFLIYNRNGGLSGGYGLVATGTNTKVQAENGYIEAYETGGQWTDGLAGFDCASMQVTNVDVVVHANNNAIRFAGGKNVQARSLKARHATGVSSSSAGVVVEAGITGLSKVDITGVNVEGAFLDAVRINTAGAWINIGDCLLDGAARYGLANLRSTTFTASNIQGINCGVAGIYDQIAAGAGGSHTYTNILATRLGAGTQPHGLKYDVDDINGRLTITGGVLTGNSTAAIDSGGSTYANPSTQVNFANLTVA